MSEAERIARAYEDVSRRSGLWDPANAGNRAILAERRQATRRLFERAGWLPLGTRRVLEVGSGTGGELAWLLELGARPELLQGVDLLPDRVEAARQAHPDLRFAQGNAEHLESGDATFDLVMAITVFSSIHEESMAAGVASEIVRVLKPGGGLLWYDLRYDSVNKDVHAVKAARVRALFPSLGGELHSVTLLPPLARRLGPATAAAYPVLSRIAPLRSHLLGLLRKAAA